MPPNGIQPLSIRSQIFCNSHVAATGCTARGASEAVGDDDRLQSESRFRSHQAARHYREMLTISEASSSLGFAGGRRHVRGRRRRSAFCVSGELFDQEIGEHLDPLGPRSTGRRDPVDCSGWQRPIVHQSFQPASSERVAQNEFWENADAGPGKQGWQHRVTVIDAQRTRWPHCRGFAVLGEAPSFGVIV